MTSAAVDTLEFPAELAQIGAALEWIEAKAEALGWPQRAVFGLTMGLDEVLTNIISYGFRESAAAQPGIRLLCRVEDGSINLQVEDNGSAFDPTQIPPPTLATSVEDASIGGHGMQLLRHYMDEIHYRREGGHNVLTLVARTPA